jgi:hypothetical protein
MSKKELNEIEKPLFAHLAGKFPTVHVVMISVTTSIAWNFPVPFTDKVFSIIFPVYLLIANALRFQFNGPARRKEINLLLLKEEMLPWFSNYIIIFATIGLIVPFGLVLLGPSDVSAAAAPHLFLLLAQITMEGVTNHECYHNLIRILVPIGFNAYRMSSLFTWVAVAFNDLSIDYWYQWGFGLAAVNLLAWSYNLFVFLLLRMTPHYTSKSYGIPGSTC